MKWVILILLLCLLILSGCVYQCDDSDIYRGWNGTGCYVYFNKGMYQLKENFTLDIPADCWINNKFIRITNKTD